MPRERLEAGIGGGTGGVGGGGSTGSTNERDDQDETPTDQTPDDEMRVEPEQVQREAPGGGGDATPDTSPGASGTGEGLDSGMDGRNRDTSPGASGTGDGLDRGMDDSRDRDTSPGAAGTGDGLDRGVGDDALRDGDTRTAMDDPAASDRRRQRREDDDSGGVGEFVEETEDERFGDVQGGVAEDIESAVDSTTDEVASALRDAGEGAETTADERAASQPEAPPGTLGAAGTSRAAGALLEGAANAASGVAEAPSQAIEGSELLGWVLSADSADERERRLETVAAGGQRVARAAIEDAQENPEDFLAESLVGFAAGSAFGTAARASRFVPDPDASVSTASRASVRQVGGAVTDSPQSARAAAARARAWLDEGGTDRAMVGGGGGDFRTASDIFGDSDAGDADGVSVESDGDGQMLVREETVDADEVPDEDARDADPNEPGELEDGPTSFEERTTDDLRDVTTDSDVDAQVSGDSEGVSLDAETVQMIRRELGDDRVDDVGAQVRGDATDTPAARDSDGSTAEELANRVVDGDGFELDDETVQAMRRAFEDDRSDAQTRGDSDATGATSGDADGTTTANAAGPMGETVPIGAAAVGVTIGETGDTAADTGTTTATDTATDQATDADQATGAATGTTADTTADQAVGTGPRLDDDALEATGQPEDQPQDMPEPEPERPPQADDPFRPRDGGQPSRTPTSDRDRRRRRRDTDLDLFNRRRRRRRDAAIEATFEPEDDVDERSFGGVSVGAGEILPGFGAETAAVFAGVDASAPSASRLREVTEPDAAALGEYPTAGLLEGEGGGSGGDGFGLAFFGSPAAGESAASSDGDAFGLSLDVEGGGLL